MVENVRQKGAEVVIFSSMHESGQRELARLNHVFHCHLREPLLELNQLTGIAAILTFPLDVDAVEAEEAEERARLEREKQEQENTDTN